MFSPIFVADIKIIFRYDFVAPLNVICDENDLFRCEGSLKNALLPYQAKAPYLINLEHYSATLIVNDIHTIFKHL